MSQRHYFIANHNDPERAAWGPFGGAREAVEFAYERGIYGILDLRLYTDIKPAVSRPAWGATPEPVAALRPEDV